MFRKLIFLLITIFIFQPAHSQAPYPADSTLPLPEVEALVNPRVDVTEATRVAPLGNKEQEFAKFLDGKKDEMVALLKEIVEINSGSRNAAGIDAVGKILSERLIKLGFKEEFIPAKAGDGIGFADAGSEATGHFLKETISATVSHGVIDLFESIEIEK